MRPRASASVEGGSVENLPVVFSDSWYLLNRHTVSSLLAVEEVSQ